MRELGAVRRLLQEVGLWQFTVGSSGDCGGAGHLVVGVWVEAADAGGAAAGGADGLGVDADDFAELTNDYHLGGVGLVQSRSGRLFLSTGELS